MRIPLLSDVHANLAALDAVLLDASNAGAGAPPWVLGDIVGYGPDPNEVVGRLRELSAIAVAGNHDLAAAGLIGVGEFNALAAEYNVLVAEQKTTVNRYNEQVNAFNACLARYTAN